MILKQWKWKNKGVLTESIFPRLLHNTLKNIARLTEDIISGFQFTSIVPLNASVVLHKIPNKGTEEEIPRVILTPMITVL